MCVCFAIHVLKRAIHFQPGTLILANPGEFELGFGLVIQTVIPEWADSLDLILRPSNSPMRELLHVDGYVVVINGGTTTAGYPPFETPEPAA